MKAILTAALLLAAPGLARAQDQWQQPLPPRPPAYAPPAPAYSPPPARLPEGAHVAQAGELCYPAPPPGQTHDGFFARLQAGGGYLSARQGDTTYSGGAGAFGFAVGAVVFPNLAVFGTLFFHLAGDPTIKVSGVSTPVSGSTIENDSFGAGLTYYLEPLNIYASAAITGTQVILYDKDDNRLLGSNTGVGFQFIAGKEWWVGREWGLGVAGQLSGAWMSDADDGSVRWSSFTYSVLFSATYN